MRLIKENTMQFESFLSTIESRKRFKRGNNYTESAYNNINAFKQPEKHEYSASSGDDSFKGYMTKLVECEKEFGSTSEITGLISFYGSRVSELSLYKGLSIFLIDKDQKLKTEYTTREEGIDRLLSLFDKNPDDVFGGKILLLNLNDRANEIVIPLFEGGTKKGLICIETHLSEINSSAPEFKYLALLSNFFASHLNIILKRKELANAHKETQHYQSKLLKDSRLSAVGEFTIGISQEILSSLQIILSSIDLLETGGKTSFRSGFSAGQRNINEINGIKRNIAKVDKLVKSVLKFSDLNNEFKFPLQPCCLNNAVEEFLELISTSSKNNNYEIVPDLQADLPPILSSPTYLKQIFISVFSLLKSAGSNGGGYIVRTCHRHELVQLIILSTDPIKLPEEREDINLKVLKNLITMHEGQIELSSEVNKGTEIILNFPLKRSI